MAFYPRGYRRHDPSPVVESPVLEDKRYLYCGSSGPVFAIIKDESIRTPSAYGDADS